MNIKTLGTITYMIVMVFYGVINMVLSIQAYVNFPDSDQKSISNIANNYQQSAIIDVIDKQDKICDQGYSSLFYWDWQGFNAGCDCSDEKVTAVDKLMYLGTCDDTYKGYGCKDVNGIDPTEFNFIEGKPGKKMNICVKRLDESQEYYKIAEKQTGDCSSQQKLCGNTSIKETVYCVGLNEECPIYDMQLSYENDLKFDDNIYTSQRLDFNLYLYIDKKGTNSKTPPLSELRITQGPGVCPTENDEMRLPYSYSQNYVLQKSTKISCEGTDTSFVPSGFQFNQNINSVQFNKQVAENKYYQYNLNSEVYDRFKGIYGHYIPQITEPYKAYQRSYLKWSVTERDRLYEFVDSVFGLNNLKKAQTACMVISIIVCVLVSIILNILYVFNLRGKDVPCIESKESKGKNRIETIKKCLAFGGKLLQTPFLLWAFIVSVQKKRILRDVVDDDLMDDDYSSQISNFTQKLEDDVLKMNLIALIVLCLVILLDIVLYLKMYFCPPKNIAKIQPAKVDEERHLTNENQPQPYSYQNSMAQLNVVEQNDNAGSRVLPPVKAPSRKGSPPMDQGSLPGNYPQSNNYQQNGNNQQNNQQNGNYQQNGDYQQYGNQRQNESYQQNGNYQQNYNNQQNDSYQQNNQRPGNYQQSNNYQQSDNYRQSDNYQQSGNQQQPGQNQQYGNYQQPQRNIQSTQPFQYS